MQQSLFIRCFVIGLQKYITLELVRTNSNTRKYTMPNRTSARGVGRAVTAVEAPMSVPEPSVLGFASLHKNGSGRGYDTNHYLGRMFKVNTGGTAIKLIGKVRIYTEVGDKGVLRISKYTQTHTRNIATHTHISTHKKSHVYGSNK